MFKLVDAERSWSERLAVRASLTATDAHAGAEEAARPTADGPTRSLTVVLDDFEANPTRDAEGRSRFTHPALADFVTAWTTLLTGASLVSVSRHPLPTATGRASRRLPRLQRGAAAGPFRPGEG
ncbi:hypothetical protein I3F58_21030 [Streptomyces sp. MUM 203J]|nr:hypothetical protein [Streptomyces sp. MUM 203J]